MKWCFYTFFRGEWLSSAIIGCFEPGTGRAAGEMGAGAFEPRREIYGECRLAIERGESSRNGVLPEHGVETVEPGFETGNKVRGREVMTTRYCLLFELGMCRKTGKDKALKFPLYLSNNWDGFDLNSIVNIVS